VQHLDPLKKGVTAEKAYEKFRHTDYAQRVEEEVVERATKTIVLAADPDRRLLGTEGGQDHLQRTKSKGRSFQKQTGTDLSVLESKLEK
jgi:hypothetical protein